MAYSLSASLVYFGAAAIFNGISVMYLWSKQGRPTRAQRRRLTNVVICAVGQVRARASSKADAIESARRTCADRIPLRARVPASPSWRH